jgi:pimeloyl-ACP methyl ester carboxylesterase
MKAQNKQNPGGKRKGCLWWGIVVMGGMFALCMLLFLAAFTVEKITLAQIPTKYPAPGQMVDIGKYSLHLYCAGDPSVKPVVVVSPGSGSNVAQWPLVQPEVAKFTRICIYDRPGSGWSFVAPQGQTYQEEAQDVHIMLQNAGIPGPYVLVGHSLGGAVVQVYASLYPQDVIGMVMVDPRTRGLESKQPLEFVKTNKMTEQGSYAFSIPGVLRLLNWFGVLRTVPTFESMPPDLREVAYGLDWNSRFFSYQKASIPIDEQREALFISAEPLPDVLLIVIAHGKTDHSPGVNSAEDVALQADRIWLDEMKKLATEASQGTYIVAENSGHNIQLEQPDVVIDAIRTIVEQIRAK